MKNLDENAKDLCTRSDKFEFVYRFKADNDVKQVLNNSLEKIQKKLRDFKPIIKL